MFGFIGPLFENTNIHTPSKFKQYRNRNTHTYMCHSRVTVDLATSSSVQHRHAFLGSVVDQRHTVAWLTAGMSRVVHSPEQRRPSYLYPGLTLSVIYSCQRTLDGRTKEGVVGIIHPRPAALEAGDGRFGLNKNNRRRVISLTR